MPRAGPRKVHRYSLEFKLKAVKAPPARTMKRFQALHRAHALLQEEHALLKTLIRFTSARKPTSSRSSTKNGKRSA